jgi:hypothetical protein
LFTSAVAIQQQTELRNLSLQLRKIVSTVIFSMAMKRLHKLPTSVSPAATLSAPGDSRKQTCAWQPPGGCGTPPECMSALHGMRLPEWESPVAHRAGQRHHAATGRNPLLRKLLPRPVLTCIDPYCRTAQIVPGAVAGIRVAHRTA